MLQDLAVTEHVLHALDLQNINTQALCSYECKCLPFLAFSWWLLSEISIATVSYSKFHKLSVNNPMNSKPVSYILKLFIIYLKADALQPYIHISHKSIHLFFHIMYFVCTFLVISIWVWKIFSFCASPLWYICMCMLLLLLHSLVWLFEIPWHAARQASLSLAISQSLHEFISIALVMPSSHLILWHSLLL